jgi:hypothetical protein
MHGICRTDWIYRVRPTRYVPVYLRMIIHSRFTLPLVILESSAKYVFKKVGVRSNCVRY